MWADQPADDVPASQGGRSTVGYVNMGGGGMSWGGGGMIGWEWNFFVDISMMLMVIYYSLHYLLSWVVISINKLRN